MPRILHTADWQIGRLFSQLPADDAVPLAEARLAAVETIARLAVERGVDAVLVAGDVFDAQAVADRTIRRLFQALEGYAGPWLLMPGNHDAALAESVWTRARRLGVVPPHVRLALEPGIVEIEPAGLSVLAAPLTQRHTHDDLTRWFDTAATPASHVRVGLAHGCVEGVLAETIDSANPLAVDRARRARLDYLALGDWHGTRRIDERTWYSGTPEPDRFRANDPGAVLDVRIDAPGALPQVTRVATGRHVWESAEHAIAVASDVDAFIARWAEVPADRVLELRLHGAVDLAGLQRLHDALARVGARVRCLQADLDGLRLVPTDADIAALSADGYLGDVIADLRERQAGSGESADVAALALSLLAGFLAGGDAAGGAA